MRKTVAIVATAETGSEEAEYLKEWTEEDLDETLVRILVPSASHPSPVRSPRNRWLNREAPVCKK